MDIRTFEVKSGMYEIVFGNVWVRVNGIVLASGWLEWRSAAGYKGLARPGQWRHFSRPARVSNDH